MDSGDFETEASMAHRLCAKKTFSIANLAHNRFRPLLLLVDGKDKNTHVYLATGLG